MTLYRLGFGFSRSFSQMQTRKGLSKTSALPLKAETKSFMSSPPGEKVTTLKYFVSRFPSSSKLRRKEAWALGTEMGLRLSSDSLWPNARFVSKALSSVSWSPSMRATRACAFWSYATNHRWSSVFPRWIEARTMDSFGRYLDMFGGQRDSWTWGQAGVAVPSKRAASGASSALFDLRFIGGSAYRCQSMFANRTGGTLYGLPKRTYL